MNEKKLVIKRIGLVILSLAVLFLLFVILFKIFRQQLGSAFLALDVGGLGAGVFLFRRIPKLNEDQIKALSSSWWNLLTPILVGVIMGGVLYMVFFAGILTGDGGRGLFTSNLFPNFTSPPNSGNSLLSMQNLLDIRPSSIQDVGKLLVWCFLSGYSEKFVPSLLDSLEKKASDSKDVKEQ